MVVRGCRVVRQTAQRTTRSLVRQLVSNRSRSSGRKRWASQRIGWFSAGRGKKTKSNARLKSMEKKSSQTAASKPTPQQERRRIRKEAKGSQCAGKRGSNRATSNAQSAKSMLRAGFTKIATCQTSKSSFAESGRSIRRERRMSSAIERERTRLLDGHRGRHARRLWVPGPSNGR